MEVKNIMLVFAIVVILGMVTVPYIGIASATEKTYTNEGYFEVDEVTDDTITTITFTKTLNTVNVDGTDIVVDSDSAFTVIGSDSLIFRWQTGASSNTVRLYSTDSKLGLDTSSGDYTYIQCEISDNTLTITSDQTDFTTITATLGNSAFVISSDGEYVMKYSNEGAYITDSTVYLIGISVGTSFNSALGIFGSGTISDGMTLSTIYQGNNIVGDVTYSTPVADYSEVSECVGLYNLNKYTATVYYNDTSMDLTYSYFIVPKTVTAELSAHMSAIEINLLNLVPLFCIVGMVVVVASLLIFRKD